MAWTAIIFAAVLPLWVAGVAIYNIYFHPLAKVPGPKLAAITSLYKTKFYLQIDKLHQEYGPVVRICPNEVHLSDPENYDAIYHAGTKFSKDPVFYGAFGYGTAAFPTPSNEVHRVRRAALNPLFSRKRVLELEDVVHSKVEKVSHRISQSIKSKTPVDLHHACRAISVDTITDYGFGHCYDLLDEEDFGISFFDAMRELGPAVWFFQQWPFLQKLALSIPYWLAKRMSGNLEAFMRLQMIVAIKEAKDRGEKPKTTTIFSHLMDPKAAEGHVVPSVDDLTDEAFIILSAAQDTTGNAMTVALYETISNPEIYAKVVEELKQAFPNPNDKLDFLTIEKLPYLTAVIKESLRVTPEGGATFNGISIPAGTVVGMSAYMMHRDPTIFPSPDKFDPSRWLDPAAARHLEKYLVPFSKGPRQCVGMP
ncbi:hypothetical protein DH86_00003913 [Scytalidium sp. 3C]|nr:hypothetical protein DH86_00003913 [Scytalidium sp. 3C]